MQLWVVIHEDRHYDTEVEVWLDEAGAIESAQKIVQEHTRHPDGVEVYLNEAMIRGGWVFNATYSGEGDSVRVVKTELKARTTR